MIFLLSTGEWANSWAQDSLRGSPVVTGTLDQEEVAYVDGLVLVKPQSGVSKSQILSILPQSQVDTIVDILYQWYLIKFQNGTDIPAIIDSLSRSSIVQEAEPDLVGDLLSVPPNDSLFSSQWYLRNTGQAPPGGTVGADINYCMAACWPPIRTTR